MELVQINKNYSYVVQLNTIVKNEVIKLGDILKKRAIRISDRQINTESIKSEIKNLNHIIFEVTTDCNLRCRYCSYGGDYFYERKRSNSHMTFDIAKTGMDYIYGIIRNRLKKEIFIGFFGGEPSLDFSLIKKIVHYSQNLFKKWRLKFSITSNGTNLTDEMISFFIDNNFSLHISLDGPKENHDAKRVFKSGRGSFDLVWENILKIKKKDEKYFYEKVLFLAVYSKDLSLKKVIDFFKSSNIISKNNLKLSFVNESDTEYYLKNPYDYTIFLEQIDKAIKGIGERIEGRKRLSSIELQIKNKLLEFKYLNVETFSTLAGACLFNSRLIVDTQGNFHICDKINDKFPIGNVRDGFDIKRMEKMVKDFIAINKRHCSLCDFRYLCFRCYVTFAKDGYFEFDEKLCEKLRKTFLGQLREYVKFNEFLNRDKNKLHTIRFHQFIMLEKGPVNTAIINFLDGNLFQVENDIIEKFQAADYEEIKDFITAALNEKLILRTAPGTWMPGLFIEKEKFFRDTENILPLSLIVEMEDGTNLDLIKEKFKDINIAQINFYSDVKIDNFFPSVHIEYKKKDFNVCRQKSSINGNFGEIKNENEVFFNKKYNSCWGKKIAISSDGKIRPCIFSKIELGDIKKAHIGKVLEKLRVYWELTKDKVEKCNECELRYVCFDCREIAINKGGGGDLCSTNPNCKYNPRTGVWI